MSNIKNVFLSVYQGLNSLMINVGNYSFSFWDLFIFSCVVGLVARLIWGVFNEDS